MIDAAVMDIIKLSLCCNMGAYRTSTTFIFINPAVLPTTVDNMDKKEFHDDR